VALQWVVYHTTQFRGKFLCVIYDFVYVFRMTNDMWELICWYTICVHVCSGTNESWVMICVQRMPHYIWPYIYKHKSYDTKTNQIWLVIRKTHTNRVSWIIWYI